ncbi:MAG: hypothetical protein LBQ74_13715 [Prevotella sp.]|jgi:hypothetical protein|nr:hypothetical protein [Prevotella sp.]
MEESYEKIKAERDAMKWFIDSLDERIVINSETSGRRKHHEILHYIKAGLFDLRHNLVSIRDKYPFVKNNEAAKEILFKMKKLTDKLEVISNTANPYITESYSLEIFNKLQALNKAIDTFLE